MSKSFDPIEELKFYLMLQLEAHLKQDWEIYEQLEKKIQSLEKEI